MSTFADEFDAAAELLDEQFGEAILYIRGAQAITVTGAIRGTPRVERLAMLREDQRAELHGVDWVLPIAQLADLVEPEDTPDVIEDADGARYTVASVVGDQDWDYAHPDKRRVRVHTLPE